MSRTRVFLPIILLITLLLSIGCSAPVVQTSGTQRASVAGSDTQANQRSKQPSISADGRYVAFASDASNLVRGDTNGVSDVFVRDLQTNKTTRVSVANDGKEADSGSYWPYISQDGRYVTFTSEADNLIKGDTNGVSDVFVYDRQTNKTDLISVGVNNTPANDLSFWSSISADGRYVVFMSNATNLIASDTNDSWDVFLRDRQNGVTSLVSFGYDGSQANSQSEYPVISADGQSIAFASDATNIVAGDTNGYRDVFVYDRKTSKSYRVSVASDGTQANDGTQAFVISISADGQVVAFPSLASNLVPDDTNNAWDIFIHDMKTFKTTRVSVASDGSQANAGSYGVSISADGRYVAFGSNASNLVLHDTNGFMDVFVHDLQTGKTERVSLASDGTQGDEASGYTLIVSGGIDMAYGSLISNDGSRVVYMSNATNLVEGDTNASQDIFVYTK
jgi:Tol biopolymer transport system component